jgi:hypothetical protein
VKCDVSAAVFWKPLFFYDVMRSRSVFIYLKKVPQYIVHGFILTSPLKQGLLLLLGAEVSQSHRSGNRQPKTYVKPEAAITVFELLMMGGV